MYNQILSDLIDLFIKIIVPVASLIVTIKAYNLQKSGSKVDSKLNNQYIVSGTNNQIQNNVTVNETSITLNNKLQSIQDNMNSSRKLYSKIFGVLYILVLLYFFITHLNNQFPNIPYTSIHNFNDIVNEIMIFIDYLFKNLFSFANEIFVVLLSTISSSTKLFLTASSILALMVLILSLIRTKNKLIFFTLSLFYLTINVLLYMIIPSTNDFFLQASVKGFVEIIYLFISFICSVIILFDLLKIIFSKINYDPRKDLNSYVSPILIIAIATFIDWLFVKDGYILILEKLSHL